jgi:hypothetical protein
VFDPAFALANIMGLLTLFDVTTHTQHGAERSQLEHTSHIGAMTDPRNTSSV